MKHEMFNTAKELTAFVADNNIKQSQVVNAGPVFIGQLRYFIVYFE